MQKVVRIRDQKALAYRFPRLWLYYLRLKYDVLLALLRYILMYALLGRIVSYIVTQHLVSITLPDLIPYFKFIPHRFRIHLYICNDIIYFDLLRAVDKEIVVVFITAIKN